MPFKPDDFPTGATRVWLEPRECTGCGKYITEGHVMQSGDVGCICCIGRMLDELING